MAGARSSSSWIGWASPTATRAPITHRPAGRSSASTKQPRASSVEELRDQLVGFGGYDNTARPHRALGRRTPAASFAARPKARPSLQRFTNPAQYRVRRDKVDITGVITLRHNSRLHHIGLGRRLTGTRVLVLVADLHVTVLSEDGELIRALTLDPSRDYQAMGRP